MKLTLDEARAICASYINNQMPYAVETSSTDLEIEVPAPPQTVTASEEKPIHLMELLGVAKSDGDKITVVKTLRSQATSQGVHIGLADAKWFVEAVNPRFQSPTPPPELNLMAFVGEARHATPETKITHIKKLRELAQDKGFCVSLSDAKYFVEFCTGLE